MDIFRSKKDVWQDLFPGENVAAIAVSADDGEIVTIAPRAREMLGIPGANVNAARALGRRIHEAGRGHKPATFRWRQEKGAHEISVRVLRLTLRGGNVLLGRLQPVNAALDAGDDFDHISNLLDGILSSTSFNSGLAILLRQSAIKSNWCYAEAWVPDDAGKVLSAAQFHWADARFALLAGEAETHRFSPGEGPLGRTWQSGVAEWLPDLHDAPAGTLPYLQSVMDVGLTASYLLPLLHENRVVCVLQYFLEQPTREDRVLFETLARFAGVIAMVLERNRIEASLSNRDALLQSLFGNLPCSVYRRALHPDGRVSYPYVGGRLLPELGLHTGAEHEDIDDALGVLHPDDRSMFIAEIYRSAREHAPLNVDYRVQHPDGTLRWLRTWSMPSSESDGRVTWDCFSLDVTEEKRLRQQAEDQAQRDAVTRLPTRQVFETELPRMVTHAAENKEKLAVLIFNADRFRWINDAYGMATGDAVLAAVADRLLETLPTRSLLARIASDEFVLAIGGIHDVRELRRHIAVLQRVMHDPFRIFEQEIFLTYTSGLCIYPDDSTDAGSMLRCASLAMHRGRRESKGKITRFAAELDQESVAVISVERQLRVALRERQLEVHYQPQVAPAFNELIGFEALARWRHPQDGMIPPSRFVPIAEESGLVDELFLYVLDAVCAQYSLWQRAGHEPPPVSVNLSAAQMHVENTIARDVARILARHAVPPACLKLEITEGTLLRNFDTGLALLNTLGEMGVAVVLDDFGVGYSSLGYLAQLPVRSIKIDRSFVTGLDRNVNAAKVLRAVVTLARSLDMTVTVEGVETDVQLATIRQLDCHGIQGYLFSKPLPPGEATELLARMQKTV